MILQLERCTMYTPYNVCFSGQTDLVQALEAPIDSDFYLNEFPIKDLDALKSTVIYNTCACTSSLETQTRRKKSLFVLKAIYKFNSMRIFYYYSHFVLNESFLLVTGVSEKRSLQSFSPSTWKQSKSKRVRTIFTPEQLERLEAEFERQQYMVGTERYNYKRTPEIKTHSS